MNPELRALIDAYEVFFLDAYGVLVTSTGPVPGAAGLIAALRASARRFVVLTNDASRTPARCAERYRALGLAIDASEVISSGARVPEYLRAAGLVGAPTIVLGPEDARTMTAEAGVEIVEPEAVEGDDSLAAVVVADEAFQPFIPRINATITAIVRAVEAGRPPALVLPNPDVLYPRGGGALGITAGAVAALIEASLVVRLGGARAPRFVALGKPHRAIFEAAAARTGPGRTLMVGDQLDTDVVGARRFGIDVALVETGVGRPRPGESLERTPTHVLSALL